MYKTLFSTAYFGLFIMCELTLTDSGHAVKAVDVCVGRNKDKMMFVLCTSKTQGKSNKPQLIKIASKWVDKIDSKTQATSALALCPFELLMDYIAFRG